MADDWKPERVSSSALIQLGGTNFFNMSSVEELQAAEASAPQFHRRMLDALKASGKVRDDGTHDEVRRHPGYAPAARNVMGFRNGSRALDRKTGRKVTIIYAKAGYTKKSKTPVHRVASRNGDSWLARENDLELIL